MFLRELEGSVYPATLEGNYHVVCITKQSRMMICMQTIKNIHVHLDNRNTQIFMADFWKNYPNNGVIRLSYMEINSYFIEYRDIK